jgi:hypothetical protein
MESSLRTVQCGKENPPMRKQLTYSTVWKEQNQPVKKRFHIIWQKQIRSENTQLEKSPANFANEKTAYNAI